MPSFRQSLVTPKKCRGSNTVIMSLQLPPGSYIVIVKADVSGDPGLSPVYRATLAVGRPEVDETSDYSPLRKVTDFLLREFYLVVGVNLAAPTNAQFFISMESSTVEVNRAVMIAHSVETFTLSYVEGDPLGGKDSGGV